MTDEQVEKIIKSNMMLQMNLAGIRADFEEASQRTWVGLTHADLKSATRFESTKNHAELDLSKAFWAGARWAEDKLKDKNT